MAGEDDFIGFVSDDDLSEEIERPGEEDPVEEGKGSVEIKEAIEEDPYEAPELDDFALYELKTKYYHVIDVTGRDDLKRGRVVDFVSQGEVEQETPRKKRKVETETDGQDLEDDPDYRYYNDDEGEEEVELLSVCGGVAGIGAFIQTLSARFCRLSDSAVFTNKVMDLEDQWKRLHKAEVELDLKRAELIQAQTKLVLQLL